jgi:hypothetical protein
MAVQFDVNAKHLNASGSVFAGPTRVKGFSICATASSAGTVLIEVDIPSNSNPNSFYTLVPGDGVKFNTNVYATLTGIASITVYYG